MIQHFAKIITRFSLQNVSNMNGREYTKLALIIRDVQTRNSCHLSHVSLRFSSSCRGLVKLHGDTDSADTLILCSSCPLADFRTRHLLLHNYGDKYSGTI